jgi:hypothetical protein
MKNFFLALLIITIIPSLSSAIDKEEIHTSFDFERMKARSNYTNDLNRPMKQGQLFILWISHEDLKLYRKLKRTVPDAVHCFIESSKLQNVQPGIVIGKYRNDRVEQVKYIDPGLPSDFPADIINPLFSRDSPEESPWIGFKH